MKKITKIVILLSFFIIILIPLLLTDFEGGKISSKENRLLATFPQIVDSQGNISISEIGKLDDWLNDNIGLREQFVSAYTNIMVKCFGRSSNEKVLFGKDGWYFYTLDNNVEIGLGEHLLTDEQLQTIAKNQQIISDYYKNKGIEYTLVITPSKASVYTEELPQASSLTYTMADQVTEYLTKNTDIKVISVKDAVIDEKQNGQTFLKTDTHWNQFGSYAAYREIIENLDGDMTPVDVDFTTETYELTGEMGSMLGEPTIFEPETCQKAVFDQHSYFITEGDVYNSLAAIQQQVEHNYPAVVLRNDTVSEKRLLILGDSQWETIRSLPQYFAENYSDVVSMRADTLYQNIDLISNPDTILFACSERYIDTKLLHDVPSYILNSVDLPSSEETENAEVMPAETPTTRICVDQITDGTADNSNQSMKLTSTVSGDVNIIGWAGDLANMSPLKSLYAEVNGTLINCNYGIDRESVSSYYGNENMRYTGFSVTIPSALLKSADKINFILQTNDNKLIRCEYAFEKLATTAEKINALPIISSGDAATEIWVDYCNGTSQTTARTIYVERSGAETVMLTGWCADLTNGVPFGKLYVNVNGEFYECAYGIERTSVSDFYGNENLKNTGFSIYLPIGYFNNGISQLQFVAINSDGSARYEDMIYNISYDAKLSVKDFIQRLKSLIRRII